MLRHRGYVGEDSVICASLSKDPRLRQGNQNGRINIGLH